MFQSNPFLFPFIFAVLQGLQAPQEPHPQQTPQLQHHLPPHSPQQLGAYSAHQGLQLHLQGLMLMQVC